MAITDEQLRLLCRNQLTAFIAKITIPGVGSDYLTTSRGPFADFILNTGPVNPIITSISGLAVSDVSRVSGIKIHLQNKKVSRQASNPLASAVHFSDLVKEGLDRAEIEIKELVANAAPVSVTSFSSPYLTTIFKGQVRAPFEYQDDAMTIGATYADMRMRREYPIETLHEDGGADPRIEHAPIPIVMGDLNADIVAFRDEAHYESRVNVIPDPPVSRAQFYDEKRRLIILSGKSMPSLQFVTVKAGDLPAGHILDEYLESYVDPDHSGYTIRRITHPGLFTAVSTVRATHASRESTTYGAEDIAGPVDRVTLAKGETLAVTAPVYNDFAGAQFLTCYLCVHFAEFPDGAKVDVNWGYEQHWEGGRLEWWDLTVIHAGDLIGDKAYLSSRAAFENLRLKIIDEIGLHRSDITKYWAFFSNDGGLNVRLVRTDDVSGDVVVAGLYWLPVLLFTGYGDVLNDDVPYDLGVTGLGLRWHGGGVVENPNEPWRVIYAFMKDVQGYGFGDLDFDAANSFDATAGWKFGYGLGERKTGEQTLKELQDLGTLRIIRDPDGVYRPRLKSRMGGQPVNQRYGRKLAWGRDVLRCPTIKPLGDDWVKNVIVVDYAPREDGSFSRSAWVNASDSDNGLGMRTPEAEAIANTSINTDGYGEQRLEIKAWAVQDADTAVGIRDYHLARRAKPPTRIEIPLGLIGADIPIGFLVEFDETTMDPVILFNGDSWAGKWFEIEDMKRSSNEYVATAISVPEIGVETIAMVPRYVMVTP